MTRDKNGRFAKGNKGGPGRPRRTTEQEYLNVMVGAVSKAAWKRITKRAVAQAEAGDKDARRWLSDYLLGKPIAPEGRADNLIEVILTRDDT